MSMTGDHFGSSPEGVGACPVSFLTGKNHMIVALPPNLLVCQHWNSMPSAYLPYEIDLEISLWSKSGSQPEKIFLPSQEAPRRPWKLPGSSRSRLGCLRWLEVSCSTNVANSICFIISLFVFLYIDY